MMRFHSTRQWIVSPEGKVIAEVQSKAMASGDRASATNQTTTATSSAGGSSSSSASSFSRTDRDRQAAIDG